MVELVVVLVAFGVCVVLGFALELCACVDVCRGGSMVFVYCRAISLSCPVVSCRSSVTGAGAGAVDGVCGGEGVPVAGVFFEVVFLFVGQVGSMRLWVRTFGVNMRAFVYVGGAIGCAFVYVGGARVWWGVPCFIVAPDAVLPDVEVNGGSGDVGFVFFQGLLCGVVFSSSQFWLYLFLACEADFALFVLAV